MKGKQAFVVSFIQKPFENLFVSGVNVGIRENRTEEYYGIFTKDFEIS